MPEKKVPNLFEAFSKVREEKGSLEAFRRFAYAESALETKFADAFNKGLGTRSVNSCWNVIEEMRAQIVKDLPALMLSQTVPIKGNVQISQFSLSYLIDWLVADEKYPVEDLADRFQNVCSELYKRDGMFPLTIYNGCYDLLINLLSRRIRP